MIHGELTVIGLMKMIGIGAAGIGAIGVGLSALGFGIKTPGATLNEYKAKHAAEHVVIDSAIISIDTNMSEQKDLIEALIIGECLNRKYTILARQGILDTCKNLGIERKSNDAVDRELRSR